MSARDLVSVATLCLLAGWFGGVRYGGGQGEVSKSSASLQREPVYLLFDPAPNVENGFALGVSWVAPDTTPSTTGRGTVFPDRTFWLMPSQTMIVLDEAGQDTLVFFEVAESNTNSAPSPQT